MVTKTQARRKQDIKSKLMAAIAMLLVSSIMMVSSTYAWFTLSTAPEVTGISTAVGANGNLEIALLPKTGDTNAIGSAVGDSMLAIEAKNTTWGNLVDLSDNTVYGLDKITLYPAELNGEYLKNELATINMASLLKTPTYGSDGRVATLNANTSTGYFNATENEFMPNAEMGVRAVGTASGMTSRQLVYRNARAAANTAAAAAKSVASQSLNNNGSTLANIAIKKGTGSDKFDLADLNSMKAIIDDLLGTDTKKGSLQYIETAYMQYILAYSASAAIEDVNNDENTQAYKAVQGLVETDGATLSSVINGLGSAGVTLPPEIHGNETAPIDKLLATKTKVENARTELNTLIVASQETYTWNEISDVLYGLANPDTMEVNGIPAGEIMQDGENGEPNMSNLVNSVAGQGLKVTMKSGGGVYADIADHCGDYTASVVIEEVSYGGLTLRNMTARMETSTSGTGKPYLNTVGTTVEGAGAPASGNTTVQPITDMFGYVIDLAFRTNAAESKLLLQRDAVDRIYGDNANEGTMGHGSNMTFNIVNELNEDGTKGLMKAIRLVFFDPSQGNKVLMNAKLDGDNAYKNEAGEWVADFILYKSTSTTSDGVTTYDEEPVNNDEIMPLTQNQVHQLSVLVYLDGNKVTNKDVAAAAATSMVGKLNLQFASSATLVPMDYAQLHTPSTNAETVSVTLPEGVQGNATTNKNATYTFTVQDGYTLGTVTVGGATVNPTAGENGVYTIPAASVTGNIVITATANGA